VHARVRIGSQVVGPDGKEQIGMVEKVVINPKTRQVTHLLVHRGPLPILHHDVMVPIDAVSAASEATVELSVPVDVLNRMAAYDAADYVAPAATWEPPEGYRRDEVLFAFPRRVRRMARSTSSELSISMSRVKGMPRKLSVS
jgi:sporulation protein YlmC with PRC-barrel domain